MRIPRFSSSLAITAALASVLLAGQATVMVEALPSAPSGALSNKPDLLAASPTSEPTFQFTKTWPVLAMPTFTETFPRDSMDSPSFPDPEYVKLLDYSLLFYEAQRSGKLPVNNRVPWRNDSALQDGKDQGVDLTGGYYDAGDYMKFIFPLTFTMTEICWGGLRFFDGYQMANQTQYLNDMVRWGMDWLIKAHPNNNTLYVQVGVSEVDNNYWGPDISIPNPRPSFFVSNTKPGTDVIADAAAAFASCSMLYRDKLSDTAYASTLATHADALYRMAETASPQQVYQKVVPAATCCYASSGFVDELAWAAAWMFRLTGDATYKTKASNYIAQLSTQGTRTDVVTWDTKTSFVYLVMAEATLGTADNDNWVQLAIKYADTTVDPSKPCQFTRGGLYWCGGNSDDDSAVVAANAAFGLRILSTVLGNSTGLAEKYSEQVERYNAFALRQIEYLLGDNPMKTPYIVGVHPNSPLNPHSALAAGGNDPATIDSFPKKEAYVLHGALVGGPDNRDRFKDQRSDWRQSEVALDYNAPFTGLMASQVMTSHQSPPYVVIPEGRPELPTLINGMEIWQVILIAVGVVFVILAIASAVCYRKRVEIRSWLAARKERRIQQQLKLVELEKRTAAIRVANAAARQTAVSETPTSVPNTTTTPPLPPNHPTASSEDEAVQDLEVMQPINGTTAPRRPVPPPPLPARK